MSDFIERISEYIWDSKYRYRYNGKVLDNDIEQTWQRVAKAVAKAESRASRKHWQQSFYQAMENFRFLPGGRILAGAGTRHKVTLFNCFVMGRVNDSLNDIFTALKQGALTLQQGGGIGYDFSNLRPAGVAAKTTGAVASGPISFMRIWDSMCATMQSTGARRGAMMATLRCDHPDIEKFILAKHDPSQLRHFNISVLVSDEFMQAVADDAEWQLVFPTDHATKKSLYRAWAKNAAPIAYEVHQRISARKLWDLMIRSAYDSAEPGVLFEDTINRTNNLWYREHISATNPCGEIPLPHYGACDLASINLTQFVVNAFSEKAALDWHALEEIAILGVRFLDNIIDVSRYPHSQQRQVAHDTRRIGLGITGLADALVMLGIRYGSEGAQKFAEEVMQRLCYTSWQASCELAKEKQSFPAFELDAYLHGDFVQSLPNEIIHMIETHGMRNSHHNTIAPTGTISILANNISSGIEPIFAKSYQRQVRTASGELKQFDVQDYAYRRWCEHDMTDNLPDAWIDAQKLTPDEHLNMQTVMQPYIDNAISKTIFIPEDFPFEDLKDVYLKAYRMGLKGCTIFRPNPITGSVIDIQSKEHKHRKCCAYGEDAD